MGDELAQIAEWRTNVFELVADCCDRWGLRIGEPYVPGACGHVVRVELEDARPAVLKVFWPHREAEQAAMRSRVSAPRSSNGWKATT